MMELPSILLFLFFLYSINTYRKCAISRRV
jgi:hypothetical protein